MYSKSDYRSKISKLASQKRVASFESILAKVDSMTEQQRDEFVANFVKTHGLSETINLVRKTLADTATVTRQAQMYEGLKNNPPQTGPMAVPTPSQFSQKLNNAGEWGYMLTILLMIGTAGAADLGADWKTIFKGFAITIGSGFLSWVIKKLSSYVK